MSRAIATRCDLCGQRTLDDYPKGWLKMTIRHWNGHGGGDLDICETCAPKVVLSPIGLLEMATAVAGTA